MGKNTGKHKKQGKSVVEKDYCKIMHEAEFYNYDRIPGYNHLTGWIDKRHTRYREDPIIDPLYVKINTY